MSNLKTILFLSKETIAFTNKLQQHIDKSTRLLLISYNDILNEYDISNNSIEYICIDYSKADNLTYALLHKILKAQNLPSHFKSISNCLFLKLDDHFFPLLRYLYIIESVIESANSQDIMIVVDDRRIVRLLRNIVNIKVYYNKILCKKRITGSHSLILKFIKKLWIERYVVHLINGLHLLRSRTEEKTNFKSAAIFDTYNQSAIEKLDRYIDNALNREEVLNLITDKRLLSLCKGKKNYVFLTSLLSLDDLSNIFRDFIIIRKSLCTQSAQISTHKIIQLIPKVRFSLYLALAWCEYRSYLKFLGDNESIKNIVSATAIHSSSFLLIQASRMRNISSVVVQHGYPIAKVGYLPIHSTHLAVYHRKASDVFKSWGVKNIVTVDLNSKKYKEDRKMKGSEVLVCLSARDADNYQIFSHLENFNREYGEFCSYRIRKHPGSSQLSDHQKVWVKNTNGAQFDHYINCVDSIADAVCVISCYSSVVQEASDFGVPVIMVSDLVRWSNFNFPNVYQIESYNDFSALLKRLFTNVPGHNY